MAITIPKLITDITPYFKYENESGATTQDQFQAYLKNEHNVLEVLTKGLWQASTAYTKGQMIHTPNMPEKYVAICNTAGTSGANEPTWSAGSSSITDGTANWRMVLIEHATFTGATTSANGKSGLVPAPTSGDATRYLRSDGTWVTPPDTIYTLPSATDSVLGGVKVGSNITVSSGIISLTKANVVSALGYTPPSESITITASTETTKSEFLGQYHSGRTLGDVSGRTDNYIAASYVNSAFATVASQGNWGFTPTVTTVRNNYTASVGKNKYSTYFVGTNDYALITTGVSAKTTTIKALLQELVDKSHTHSFARDGVLYNCNCDCDCNDSG